MVTMMMAMMMKMMMMMTKIMMMMKMTMTMIVIQDKAGFKLIFKAFISSTSVDTCRISLFQSIFVIFFR